jgi:hypothetical protein
VPGLSELTDPAAVQLAIDEFHSLVSRNLLSLLNVVVDEFLDAGLDESDLGQDLVGGGTT